MVLFGDESCDHFGLSVHLSPRLGANYVLICPPSCPWDQALLSLLRVTQETLLSTHRPWLPSQG